MGRLLILITSFLGLAIAGATADGKPDFTGNWTLNLDRSNFGKSTKPTGMTLKVSRNGDVMHAVQTTDSQAGPSDTENEWVLDGKEHDSASATPGKLVTKWEGNVIYSERKADDGSFLQRIWLAMSPDGKTATEKVLTKGAEGMNVATLVWERR